MIDNDSAAVDHETPSQTHSPEILEKYEPVIGLEVHAQLLTASKAFATVGTEATPQPNLRTDPVVLAHPGTLPSTNEALVDLIVRMGLATDCTIREISTFARKNYFYPDLPKGYQISQFEDPICYGGTVTIEVDGVEKAIGITRIHMEEDSGKSIHDLDPGASLVDLNRAGHPLIEIVSEPDLRTPQEAFAYLTEIRRIVRWIGICSGNMEDGALRCDANVSVRLKGAEAFGTRTEVKNLNSIRGVERAISYEIERQIGVVESGGSVEQQTLGYDAGTRKTTPLRSKEEAHDYRYFPEPDLPPVVVDDARRDAIKASIPELPRARRHRFVEEFGLPAYDAAVLSDGRRLADYFEASVTALAGAEAKRIKIAGNLVMTNVLRALSDRGIGLEDLRVTPERLAELADMFFEEKISSKNVKDIFAAMLDAEGSPAEISREMGFEQSSDNDFIEAAIDQVIAENDDAVARYREGKGSLFGFFVGQTMKATNGKANPKIVNALLREKLGDPAS